MLDVDIDLLFVNFILRFGMFNRKLIVYFGGVYVVNERLFIVFDLVIKKNYYGIKFYSFFDFKFRIDYFFLVIIDNNNIYFIGGIFYENYYFFVIGEVEKDFFLYDEKELKWLFMKFMGVVRC